MKPSIYPIQSDYHGQLFIMPKPSGEWLREDIEHYRSLGIDLVVSMLEASEIEELSLGQEGFLCREHKMDFINHPIPDRGLPNYENFKNLILTVANHLKHDGNAAVHCRAGIGRSGMLVCCVLAALSRSSEDAIETVSKARGVSVPDTQDQREFIHEIVKDLLSDLRSDGQ